MMGTQDEIDAARLVIKTIIERKKSCGSITDSEFAALCAAVALLASFYVLDHFAYP